MFEDLKREDEKLTTGDTGKVEDVFAETYPAPDTKGASAVQEGKLKPASSQGAQPESGGRAPVGPPQPLTNLSELEEWSTKKSRKGVMITLITLLIIFGGGAAATFYFFSRSPATPPGGENTNTAGTNAASTPGNQNINTPTTNIPGTVPPEALIDADNDGLTDVEEQLLGTDPNSVDSDSDGLSDRDELRVHKTDPLEADSDNDKLTDRDEVFTWLTDPRTSDTDGDTYLDGDEVEHGYNPNGPGKLQNPAF